jgi:hypothetical protein
MTSRRRTAGRVFRTRRQAALARPELRQPRAPRGRRSLGAVASRVGALKGSHGSQRTISTLFLACARMACQAESNRECVWLEIGW